MIMVLDDDIYMLNVGDSRALTSVSEFPSNSMIIRAQNHASIKNMDLL
jgi:hypothetical protein